MVVDRSHIQEFLIPQERCHGGGGGGTVNYIYIKEEEDMGDTNILQKLVNIVNKHNSRIEKLETEIENLQTDVRSLREQVAMTREITNHKVPLGASHGGMHSYSHPQPRTVYDLEGNQK